MAGGGAVEADFAIEQVVEGDGADLGGGDSAGVRLAEQAGADDEVESEAAAGGADAELFLEGVQRGRENEAQPVGGVGPEIGAAAVELELELGVVEAPLGDRDARDAELFADLTVVLPAEQELDGAALLEGKGVLPPRGLVVICSVSSWTRAAAGALTRRSQNPSLSKNANRRNSRHDRWDDGESVIWRSY